jgi:hypothetical protein
MNSSYAGTQIGQMRRDEAVARAGHYRLAQIARARQDRERGEAPLSRTKVVLYRKALRIVALALLVAGPAVLR